MEYRVNRRTGDKISVIGLGTSGLPSAGHKEAVAALELALEQGINYFDLATAESACFPIFGAALAGVRRQVLYQVHFGANYAAGKPYSWTTDLETVKRSVAWQLEQLRTDYIDVGFIHCLDEESDLAAYQANGVLDYVLDLKKQGVWVFGTAADGTTDLYTADLKGPAAIVIGSEGEGMSRLVEENCDFLVSIPMKGGLNSLNASAAAAILLYEAVRQRMG